ncbi:MAG: hypothetical protein A2Y10_05935 [Planctomycetes bacterium GWF2_41_51]|nr:MAG: hypothetical protein A2Y10_05935 [Planctomycetes bacterium GWF2_41_51]
MLIRDPKNSKIPNKFRKSNTSELASLLTDRSDLRLNDNPANIELIKMAMDDPADKDCQEIIDIVVNRQTKLFATSGDCFWPNYPAKNHLIPPDDFIQLIQMPTGDLFGWTISQLCRNALVIAPTGQGKTTFVKNPLSNPKFLQNARIIAFCKKREFRGFLCVPQLYGLVNILRLNELQLPFCQPPDSVSTKIWNNELSKITASCYGKMSSQRYMNIKSNELQDTCPAGNYAKLRQFVEYLENQKCHPSTRENLYRESILFSLQDLHENTEGIFDYTNSNFLEVLFSTPGLAVIEAETLASEHLNFLITFMMRWEYCKRLHNQGNNTIICIFVLDDITSGVHKQRDYETPGGINAITENMFMGHALGMGVILITHTLSGLGEIARQNISCFVVLGLPQENSNFICDMINTNLTQAEKSKVLKRGEAIIFNSSIWHKPVYGTFAVPNIPLTCSDDMRKAVADIFLSRVTGRKYIPSTINIDSTAGNPTDKQPETENLVLSSSHIAILVAIATGRPKQATKLFQQMGWNRTQARRIVSRLESLGLICGHRFSTGRVGGQLCFYEITVNGWNILNAKGVYKPKSLTNGDFEHELAAMLLEDYVKNLGLDIKFEVDINGLRPDAASIDRKTGERHFYNVGISKEAHEVDSIEKYLAMLISENTPFTLICRDGAFAKKVKEILSQRNINQVIDIKLLADFVKD